LAARGAGEKANLHHVVKLIHALHEFNPDFCLAAERADSRVFLMARFVSVPGLVELIQQVRNAPPGLKLFFIALHGFPPFCGLTYSNSRIIAVFQKSLNRFSKKLLKEPAGMAYICC
jgi:hypothetical protein